MNERLHIVSAPDAPELPQSVEAEAILLGNLMRNNRDIDRIADIIGYEDFSEDVHGRVFQAMIGLAADAKESNPLTLRPLFLNDEAMAVLGGPGYLAKLTSSSLSIGSMDLAKQIRDMAVRRKLITELEIALAKVKDTAHGAPSVADAINDLDAAVSEVTERDSASVEASAGTVASLAITNLDAKDAGVKCGEIPCLDRLIGHISPGSLVVIGGRPGMGKSAVGLTYARGAAKQGHGVLFISLEMSALECGQRLLADEAYDEPGGVPFASLTHRFADRRQRTQLADAQQALDAMPLHIIDTAGLTIGRLGALARRWKRRLAARGQRLDLIVVDYLQKVRPNGKVGSVHEGITEVSDGLKVMAKQLGVGVIALAQLSRGVEARVDKHPVLSDLRESGSIEQDADVVLFVYRPEYYLRQAEPPKGTDQYAKWEDAVAKAENKIEFIASKQRHGQAGTANGVFLGKYQAVR
jgi:replicative DNA helicase